MQQPLWLLVLRRMGLSQALSIRTVRGAEQVSCTSSSCAKPRTRARSRACFACRRAGFRAHETRRSSPARTMYSSRARPLERRLRCSSRRCCCQGCVRKRRSMAPTKRPPRRAGRPVASSRRCTASPQHTSEAQSRSCRRSTSIHLRPPASTCNGASSAPCSTQRTRSLALRCYSSWPAAVLQERACGHSHCCSRPCRPQRGFARCVHSSSDCWSSPLSLAAGTAFSTQPRCQLGRCSQRWRIYASGC
mmetsp:Transcript_35084/g.82100  ORF Transcript_35084/g.82100 Transcript_35084/m.82100 type:complete len:248 (+) Transcript_35084:1183-1926(+)